MSAAAEVRQFWHLHHVDRRRSDLIAAIDRLIEARDALSDLQGEIDEPVDADKPLSAKEISRAVRGAERDVVEALKVLQAAYEDGR